MKHIRDPLEFRTGLSLSDYMNLNTVNINNEQLGAQEYQEYLANINWKPTTQITCSNSTVQPPPIDRSEHFRSTKTKQDDAYRRRQRKRKLYEFNQKQKLKQQSIHSTKYSSDQYDHSNNLFIVDDRIDKYSLSLNYNSNQFSYPTMESQHTKI